MNRCRIQTALTALLLCLTAATVNAAPRSIVFILIDDQRYDAMGFMNSFFETPHLDTLAENGIVFENAFVTNSLCSPSRASILTGQWSHRHGVLDNGTRLSPDVPTFPQVLQQQGYRTGFFGKWHMGGSSDDPRPGFDRWVSFRGQGPYFNPPFNIDGERTRTEGYTTDLITDYAVEFLEQQSTDKPFMAYVSHKAVHANFEPAPRHKGSYDGRQYPFPDTMADTEENYAGKPEWVRDQRNTWHGVDGLYHNTIDLADFTLRYAETLKAVDDSVGRIVETLRAKGLLESTLLVFTSDNGFQFGEHGLIDKRTMYEASIRVPLLVQCPELFEGGQRRDHLILNTDFAPTFIEAADAEIPDTVQGESFYSALANPEAPGRDAFLYTYFWERSFPQTPTVLGIRTKQYKFMQFHGIFDKYEMYDIENDPHETHNLLGSFMTTTEAGVLRNRIRGARYEDQKDHFDSEAQLQEVQRVFGEMDALLDRELERLECAPEPNWRPKDAAR